MSLEAYWSTFNCVVISFNYSFNATNKTYNLPMTRVLQTLGLVSWYFDILTIHIRAYKDVSVLIKDLVNNCS